VPTPGCEELLDLDDVDSAHELTRDLLEVSVATLADALSESVSPASRVMGRR
jgi:hypothetical protein